MKYVNHATDIFSKYGDLMAAAYDKANIWPLGDAEQGVSILIEELDEANSAMDSLFAIAQADAGIDHGMIPTPKQLGDIRGASLNAIFELLQVIAVCNKYQDVFATEVE